MNSSLNSIDCLIGNTPLVFLKKISQKSGAKIFAKMELMNPGGSVKDRIALNMMNMAEKQGKISPKTVVIEPTSGNTGIALAMICANRGYRLILTMPDTMSIERRRILNAYGAEIVLTSGKKGMYGAVQKAEALLSKYKNSYMPQQFENPANPEIHRKTTGPEIWKDTNGKIDIFVTGVGTGGTITGVGEFLKKKNRNIKLIAVEPKDSAVLSGKIPGAHKIQGIGAGFVPEVLRMELLDDIITVSNEQAFKMSKKLAQEEGILCGISAGANVYAALKISKKNQGKNIVTIICDTGERYLA